MVCLNPDSPSPSPLASCGNPFSDCVQHGLARDDDLGTLHFFPRLRVIANIREEHASALLHQQKARAARKPAEISNVGKMADQKRIEPRRSKMLAEFFLASLEVH